jgi:sulfur-oxidizing protein SoxY
MQSISIPRREVLKQGAHLGVLALFVAAGWRPSQAWAQEWNKSAFDTKTVADAAKALGGTAPAPTQGVNWGTTPDIAENGAVVPIRITSSLPKTESIAVLVEKNPNVLAANFEFPAGTDPSLAVNVKMGQTSKVYALVKADGKYFVAEKEIKVTLGGCGG